MSEQQPDWMALRGEYQLLKEYCYLNSASKGLIAPEVYSAQRDYLDKFYEHACWLSEDPLVLREEVRRNLASFLGADTEEVGFLLNSSHGHSYVCSLLKPGDHYVVMRDEFPSSTLFPMYRNHPLTFVEGDSTGFIDIGKVEAAIRDDTRIVVSSFVQHLTGFRQQIGQIGELCRKRDILFLVDATHGLGAFELDVHRDKIDFLVASSYKWLCSGFGLSVFYMRKERLEQLGYPALGWYSPEQPFELNNQAKNFRKGVVAIEAGVPNFLTNFTLGASLGRIQRIGLKHISARILRLNNLLGDRLRELGLDVIQAEEEAHRSGIVSIRCKDSERWERELFSRKIICAAKPGLLRFAVHYYSDESDIERLVATLKEIA